MEDQQDTKQDFEWAEQLAPVVDNFIEWQKGSAVEQAASEKRYRLDTWLRFFATCALLGGMYAIGIVEGSLISGVIIGIIITFLGNK